MRFSRMRVCMFLDPHFFKRIEIYESLQVLLLKTTSSRQIIPAIVTNFKLLNVCIAISAIVSVLWRWNVYDAIVARLLIMLQKSKVSDVPPCKFTKNWVGYKSPFYCSCPLQHNICENVLPSTWFRKELSESFEPHEQFASGCVQAGAHHANTFRGGAISVIFGSQVSLRVHYCERDEVANTSTLLWENNGRQNGLIWRMLFSKFSKSWWKKLLS